MGKSYRVEMVNGRVFEHHNIDVVHSDRHGQLKLMREAASGIKADRELAAAYQMGMVLAFQEVPVES